MSNSYFAFRITRNFKSLPVPSRSVYLYCSLCKGLLADADAEVELRGVGEATSTVVAIVELLKSYDAIVVNRVSLAVLCLFAMFVRCLMFCLFGPPTPKTKLSPSHRGTATRQGVTSGLIGVWGRWCPSRRPPPPGWCFPGVGPTLTRCPDF